MSQPLPSLLSLARCMRKGLKLKLKAGKAEVSTSRAASWHQARRQRGSCPLLGHHASTCRAAAGQVGSSQSRGLPLQSAAFSKALMPPAGLGGSSLVKAGRARARLLSCCSFSLSMMELSCLKQERAWQAFERFKPLMGAPCSGCRDFKCLRATASNDLRGSLEAAT